MIFSRLKKILKTRKITQKELAEKIGVSVTTINDLLKREDLKVSMLEKIAKVLQVPVSYFFDEECNSGQQTNGNGIHTNGSNNKISVQSAKKDETIKHLQEKLELKENHLEEMRQRILDKEEIIEILKNK